MSQSAGIADRHLFAVDSFIGFARTLDADACVLRGDRSRQQVGDADWIGAADDIETVLDSWFSFGPSPLPIEA